MMKRFSTLASSTGAWQGDWRTYLKYGWSPLALSPQPVLVELEGDVPAIFLLKSGRAMRYDAGEAQQRLQRWHAAIEASRRREIDRRGRPEAGGSTTERALCLRMRLAVGALKYQVVLLGLLPGLQVYGPGDATKISELCPS
ncbi:hypothetical protein THAOC_18601 [Thalassiosira oceanica]|uniref:Uncharacterized protein n=1 Tax=Thalassiosira oceanica TaxID=159749 RepID=K0S6Q9_THAOC|nr:hypothetical protein THAOC_18601 [Thalassiosira oceanica]|eukprot:EJK60975.1 hypothetical protein THAOC_18601 [Thalassiosira oceanica]